MAAMTLRLEDTIGSCDFNPYRHVMDEALIRVLKSIVIGECQEFHWICVWLRKVPPTLSYTSLELEVDLREDRRR